MRLDTSPLVELVHQEAETDALVNWLAKRPDSPWVSSTLELATDLTALVAYDKRLGAAATAAGLPWAAPLAARLACCGGRPIQRTQATSAAWARATATLLGADRVEYTVSGSLPEEYSAASTSQKADLGPPLSAETGQSRWQVSVVRRWCDHSEDR